MRIDVSLVLLALLVGCGDSAARGGGGVSGGGASGAGGAGGGSMPREGTEGGRCYGNGTCNEGLTCASSLCVNLGGSAGAGGGGAAARDGGTSGAQPSRDAGPRDSAPSDANTPVDAAATPDAAGFLDTACVDELGRAYHLSDISACVDRAAQLEQCCRRAPIHGVTVMRCQEMVLGTSFCQAQGPNPYTRARVAELCSMIGAVGSGCPYGPATSVASPYPCTVTTNGCLLNGTNCLLYGQAILDCCGREPNADYSTVQPCASSGVNERICSLLPPKAWDCRASGLAVQFYEDQCRMAMSRLTMGGCPW